MHPHEVVGDEQPASLRGVAQSTSTMWSRPAGGGDGVVFLHNGLFSNPQRVERHLKHPSIDYFGPSKFIFRDVFRRFSPLAFGATRHQRGVDAPPLPKDTL